MVKTLIVAGVLLGSAVPAWGVEPMLGSSRLAQAVATCTTVARLVGTGGDIPFAAYVTSDSQVKYFGTEFDRFLFEKCMIKLNQFDPAVVYGGK